MLLLLLLLLLLMLLLLAGSDSKAVNLAQALLWAVRLEPRLPPRLLVCFPTTAVLQIGCIHLPTSYTSFLPSTWLLFPLLWGLIAQFIDCH